MTVNTFRWVDAFVHDWEKGLEFYSELFGWHYEEQFDGDKLVYALASVLVESEECQSAVVAGLGPCDQPKSEGTHRGWGVYVQIEDLEEHLEKITIAGGSICVAPMDVMDAGRMAVVIDSCGATVHLWQPRGYFGAERNDVPGACCWFELGSPDLGKSKSFYSDAFGWTAIPSAKSDSYWMLYLDDILVAGMYAAGPSAENNPGWIPYFKSINLDSQIETCKRLGGEVLLEPQSEPSIGRYAVLSDLEKNPFGIAELL